LSYLLDTNACIALIKGQPVSVRLRFDQAVEAGGQIFVSSIAVFELWYGVGKSTRRQTNAMRLESFLSGPVRLLPFDDEDAKAAGLIRAIIESAGKPIGAYDLLMAGQALRHKMTLITANVREFSRVKELLWDNWART
jgi:tRNA(fMet)-specific endonuclease VapC